MKSRKMLKLVASMASLFTNASSNSCCYYLCHQPKFPEKLRKK
ncbi:cyclic lactone autoinducer peptide [Dethiothermospora halolimnae]